MTRAPSTGSVETAPEWEKQPHGVFWQKGWLRSVSRWERSRDVLFQSLCEQRLPSPLPVSQALLTEAILSAKMAYVVFQPGLLTSCPHDFHSALAQTTNSAVTPAFFGPPTPCRVPNVLQH